MAKTVDHNSHSRDWIHWNQVKACKHVEWGDNGTLVGRSSHMRRGVQRALQIHPNQNGFESSDRWRNVFECPRGIPNVLK